MRIVYIIFFHFQLVYPDPEVDDAQRPIVNLMDLLDVNGPQNPERRQEALGLLNQYLILRVSNISSSSSLRSRLVTTPYQFLSLHISFSTNILVIAGNRVYLGADLWVEFHSENCQELPVLSHQEIIRTL